jgi:hypothetical protein
VLLWLEDIDLADMEDPEAKRGRPTSGGAAAAAKPAATAAGGLSVQMSGPRRSSTATRRSPPSKPTGFSLGSLLPCCGRPQTRS